MKYSTFRNNEFLSIGGVTVFIIALLILTRLIDFDAVNYHIEQAGIWAPLIFILAKASTVFFAPISGSPLYILVGSLFGVTEGILYAFIGDLIGFSAIFYFSRKYGLRLIKKILSESEDRIMEIVQNNTKNTRSFIKAGALFFWFPEMIIAATGLSKMSYIKTMAIFMPFYVLGSSIFILISTGILSL